MKSGIINPVGVVGIVDAVVVVEVVITDVEVNV